MLNEIIKLEYIKPLMTPGTYKVLKELGINTLNDFENYTINDMIAIIAKESYEAYVEAFYFCKIYNIEFNTTGNTKKINKAINSTVTPEFKIYTYVCPIYDDDAIMGPPCIVAQSELDAQTQIFMKYVNRLNNKLKIKSLNEIKVKEIELKSGVQFVLTGGI